MRIEDNFFFNEIKTKSWAKNARVEKQPNKIVGRTVEHGLYFVKDSVTILGTGRTIDIAIRDAYNGLFN
jgi:hypothetical protein